MTAAGSVLFYCQYMAVHNLRHFPITELKAEISSKAPDLRHHLFSCRMASAQERYQTVFATTPCAPKHACAKSAVKRFLSIQLRLPITSALLILA